MFQLSKTMRGFDVVSIVQKLLGFLIFEPPQIRVWGVLVALTKVLINNNFGTAEATAKLCSSFESRMFQLSNNVHGFAVASAVCPAVQGSLAFHSPDYCPCQPFVGPPGPGIRPVRPAGPLPLSTVQELHTISGLWP